MNSRRRFVVLTPFSQPEVVAGILRLRGIDAHVVATESGVCVVREVMKREFADWDIAELLGGEPEPVDEPADPSDDPENIVGPLSELSAYGVVLITAELGDDVGGEAGVSGLVSAVRYVHGERGEEVQAGIMLNMLDSLVERLVIGSADAAQIGIATMDLTLVDVERILGTGGSDGEGGVS
ncbi:hypothetical protein INS90_05710 [Trueperella pecoris]|uniref:Uncharacterized protein n=1 Tax=Trueperella pecoris TaxID=2733571 RepID=A0A7M1QXP8_9ACTO|nr:hypothetical protein [Trueperella pecoris]QOR46799.1 hypothetical protein INS90_05710 [Trueperella pecoris]